MNIDQIVVTREGLAIHGIQTTIQQESHYQPTYGRSWVGDTYVPYFGGTTVTTPVPVTSQPAQAQRLGLGVRDVPAVILGKVTVF